MLIELNWILNSVNLASRKVEKSFSLSHTVQNHVHVSDNGRVSRKHRNYVKGVTAEV